jgi:ArsR family transcriptional regulator
MSALGDKTRYKIFKLILDNNELCVSEIAELLNISVPAVSQHFRTFELIGLVDKDRIGQKICYKLKLDDPIVTILVNNVRQSNE